MGKLIGLTGGTFDRLTVLERAGSDNDKRAVWRCKCACGSIAHVRGTDLRRGHVRSCGCLRRETMTKHGQCGGLTRSPTYHSWLGMIQRCTNPKATSYSHYGGRGITVCDAWLDFTAFYSDMGDRPVGMKLERMDNDKGYDPTNCKWASHADQMRNRRNTKFTVEDIDAIRSLLAVGEVDVKALATHYRCAESTIAAIKYHQRWQV